MASNKENKGTRLRGTLERCFKLVEHLRKNTDEDHTLNQTELRNSPIADILGNRDTFNKTIRTLAEILNTGENGELLPEEDWRLSYRAFRECFGDDSELDDCRASSVKDIYYKHVFSDEEALTLINAVDMSKLDRDTADELINKIRGRLMSKHFTMPAPRLNSSEFTDSPQLYYNLELIQRAISDGRMISFYFNYYNKEKKLVKFKEYTVSPHYIIANAGRYYLWGGFDSGRLCDMRIDLMTNIRISEENGKPLPSLEKKRIGRLPETMNDEFKVKQLQMSYDEPVTVWFKWLDTLGDNKTPNYTKLHDVFGSGFTVEKGGVVRVRCSEFGIVNFAIQYGDLAEIIEPKLVREKIAEKIKTLCKKYL